MILTDQHVRELLAALRTLRNSSTMMTQQVDIIASVLASGNPEPQP